MRPNDGAPAAHNPHLQRWLPSGDHLFAPGAYPWPSDVYQRLEEVLATWDAIEPPGIAAKRDAFASSDWKALIDLRSELLVGHLLGASGVHFRCPQHPDFVTTTTCTGSIEVTTRQKNDVELLEARLRLIDNPGRLAVHVAGGRAVMGEATITRIVKESAPLFATPRGGVQEFADIALTVRVGPAVDATIDIQQWVDEARAQLAEFIPQLPAIVDDKCHRLQAVAQTVPRPLVLFVDASRFGMFGSAMGPFAISDSWQRIGALLNGIALECFDAIIVAISNLQTNKFAGIVHRSSSLDGDIVARLDRIESMLLEAAPTPAVPDLVKERLAELESRQRNR